MKSGPLLLTLLLLAGLGRLVPIARAAPQESPTPAPAPAAGPALRPRPFEILGEDRQWWSFQPVRRPALPADEALGHPLDRLHTARLRPANLRPSPAASPREQVRRLHFDLLGLPPEPETVEAFERDPSPAAWERLVDRLLARPEYGERWARHWLDLVRYAESNGYERDGPKPHAWRYRDYVIRAFNTDKPYDRFLQEQLAGDELGGAHDPDALVATGFYRLHVWDDEPDSTLAAEFDELDDILVTTSTAFLGLTLGCARCHDHKFDPFSQADYYRFLAHFRSINPYGLHHTGGGGRGTGRITRPLASPEELAAWEAHRSARLTPLREKLKGLTDPAARPSVEATIRQVEGEPPPFPMALAVHEDPVKPTQVLRRGDVHSPGPEVQPGFPPVLADHCPPPAAAPATSSTSGRRHTLARWITSPAHPLTARVWVNRIWQHHFGVGLVPTPDDFGRTGQPPTHPEILDFLAAELVDGGWRTKRLHRLILTSHAYRMSSRADRPEALAVDEANRLLWRQNPRRLEAEALRDTLLALSGDLNPAMGGPSFYPSLAREVHGTQDSAGKGWGESPPAEQGRRSIYIFAKRALLPPFLEAFDYTTTTVPVGMRSVTTVAPQALMLLNDRFAQEQAARLAVRLRREVGDEESRQMERAFRLVLQRPPSAVEAKLSRDMLQRQRELAGPGDPGGALARFCGALFNLNELLHVD